MQTIINNNLFKYNPTREHIRIVFDTPRSRPPQNNRTQIVIVIVIVVVVSRFSGTTNADVLIIMEYGILSKNPNTQWERMNFVFTHLQRGHIVWRPRTSALSVALTINDVCGIVCRSHICSQINFVSRWKFIWILKYVRHAHICSCFRRTLHFSPAIWLKVLLR